MTETNISKPHSAKQEKVVHTGVEKHEYKTSELDDFLDTVFHSDFDDNENILTWMATGAPGYPMTDEKLLAKLERVPIAKALYYGTSTCIEAPADGKLYNRKALFKRLHVIVLDDIGTKVPLEKLPSDFEPTYIIESSEGNYQYGYVLETPIEVLEHAEALIQLVYDAGYSDAGGKMATKLVRLPGGENGKKGEKGRFHVKLTKSDGPYWAPEDILEVLDLGVQWDEVLEDVGKVAKQRANVSTGLTAWSPIQPTAPSLDGTVDPVLEWLYSMDMVKQETNDWVTITCPWSDSHTTGGDTAGYSPVGRGIEPQYLKFRAFKCFHEHCAGHGGHDFLEYVAANGGPEASIKDDAAELTARYAYDVSEDAAVLIKDTVVPKFIPLKNFRNLHPQKTRVIHRDGKEKDVAEVSLWVNAPNRVNVWGRTYDPTTSAKLVEDTEGRLYINMYSPPTWGAGDFDQSHVDKFVDFCEYLIPNKDSREYFLDWLGCKVQNMGFRGAAIIMIASAQGTGRTTLSHMLSMLFGTQNVEHVPFDRLTGDAPFNDFLTSPFIVSDETLDTNADRGYYKAYEHLKTLIDPRPQEMRVNPKYGRQRIQTVYSSFLMFSNHANALAAAPNDRRLYVLNNPDIPATPEYFEGLNNWIQDEEWMLHIWRWFMTREVSETVMTSPAPTTAAKDAMLIASHGAIDVALDAVFDNWNCPLITTHQVKEIIQPLHYRLNLKDNADKIINATVRGRTVGVPKKMKLGDKVVLPKIIKTRLTQDITERFLHNEPSNGSMAQMRELMTDNDYTMLREKIEEALILHEL